MLQSCSTRSIAATAACGRRGDGRRLIRQPVQQRPRCRDRRARAALPPRPADPAREHPTRTAARRRAPAPSRRFTAGRFPARSPWSRLGSAAASCDSNTASAACSRVAASGENSCKLPSAASIALRTGVVHPHLLQAAGHDVWRRCAASRHRTNLPSAALMNSDVVAAHVKRAGLQRRDDRRGARVRRTRPDCVTPWRIESKFPEASNARAAGRPGRAPGWAPAPGRPRTAGQKFAASVRLDKTERGRPGRSRPPPTRQSGRQAFLPAVHLPVATLNAPHLIGARQSPIRSLVSAT